ncbi:virulence protein [Bifidobacterium saguini DSM 23967]|uniref:Virulence protein n=2 Tax=Bifidobacterium saguini TaxID=762210 RepID=A0A087D7Z7_9BIFI|nr:RhuM family protein [Bifidobacterium saguini]KFI91647.1 virulence protein [Bifidobacterium saguini DSM 23967]QTB91872.1 virulence RhuM family protein [Bifidobacterium saguini]
MSEKNDSESLNSEVEANVVLYQDGDRNVPVQVRYEDETFWLTQKAMAELFDVNVPNISKHLSHIYEEGELDEDATISKMEIVRQEGSRKVRREVVFYNLDAIIAVGYRVNSMKATRFRQWATKTLREYIIKGFVRSSISSMMRSSLISTVSCRRLSIANNKGRRPMIRVGGLSLLWRVPRATTVHFDYSHADVARCFATSAHQTIICADVATVLAVVRWTLIGGRATSTYFSYFCAGVARHLPSE